MVVGGRGVLVDVDDGVTATGGAEVEGSDVGDGESIVGTSVAAMACNAGVGSCAAGREVSSLVQATIIADAIAAHESSPITLPIYPL